MPDLTEADYDALFAVMQADMRRMWREIFSRILAQLERTGALTVVTDIVRLELQESRLPLDSLALMQRVLSLHPIYGGLRRLGAAHSKCTFRSSEHPLSCYRPGRSIAPNPCPPSRMPASQHFAVLSLVTTRGVAGTYRRDPGADRGGARISLRERC
jgi:hypothetical protein